MALFEIKFQPGVDKQDTAVGATDRWIDSDNVDGDITFLKK